jgi:hypothetical protein
MFLKDRIKLVSWVCKNVEISAKFQNKLVGRPNEFEYQTKYPNSSVIKRSSGLS